MLKDTLKHHNGFFVLKGDICYTPSINNLVTLKDGYIVVENKKVVGVYHELSTKYLDYKLYDYTNKLIIPGLVDLHLHAPQYSFRGLGMDLELMDWLNQRTFPEETKYQNLDYANRAYSIFVKSMKISATTHACIFATIHLDATKLLMDKMEESGLVSYVGKVNMDRNAPKDLCEDNVPLAYLNTRNWVEETNHLYERTKPILTPRFIPSCSEDLLEKISRIQEEFNLPVQSHLSENPVEIEFVKNAYPHTDYYAQAYHQHGLLGVNAKKSKYPTIMAHCVYSTTDEIYHLKENNVYVAHCPSSNTNLSSGIAPIRTFIENGVSVGLGTDVAGGHSESILRAICDAIQVSKLYWRLIDDSKKALSFKEAFYLGTKGGGSFFGKVGSFEEGFDFSCVVLDDSSLENPNSLNIEERLERASYSSLDLYGICAKFVLDKKII